MRPPGFDDKSVTLEGQPDQLAELASVLASRTRLAVLQTLMRAPDALHINEIARRIGVDASPVRQHLEILLKQDIVEEVKGLGRERRFTTRLRDVHVLLEGVHRAVAPEKTAPRTKQVQKLEKRLAALEAEMARLAEVGRKMKADLAEAWSEALEAEEKSGKKRRA